VIEQSKEGYYLALRRTQGTIRTDAPNWQPWLVFFLRALQQQKARLEIKMNREKLLMAKLPPLSIEIVDLVKTHGHLKIAQIVELTGANRNTLKKHLSDLVAARYIAKQGTGKGTTYLAV
jgi:Fic family protein